MIWYLILFFLPNRWVMHKHDFLHHSVDVIIVTWLSVSTLWVKVGPQLGYLWKIWVRVELNTCLNSVVITTSVCFSIWTCMNKNGSFSHINVSHQAYFKCLQATSLCFTDVWIEHRSTGSPCMGRMLRFRKKNVISMFWFLNKFVSCRWDTAYGTVQGSDGWGGQRVDEWHEVYLCFCQRPYWWEVWRGVADKQEAAFSSLNMSQRGGTPYCMFTRIHHPPPSDSIT